MFKIVNFKWNFMLYVANSLVYIHKEEKFAHKYESVKMKTPKLMKRKRIAVKSIKFRQFKFSIFCTLFSLKFQATQNVEYLSSFSTSICKQIIRI